MWFADSSIEWTFFIAQHWRAMKGFISHIHVHEAWSIDVCEHGSTCLATPSHTKCTVTVSGVHHFIFPTKLSTWFHPCSLVQLGLTESWRSIFLIDKLCSPGLFISITLIAFITVGTSSHLHFHFAKVTPFYESVRKCFAWHFFFLSAAGLKPGWWTACRLGPPVGRFDSACSNRRARWRQFVFKYWGSALRKVFPKPFCHGLIVTVRRTSKDGDSRRTTRVVPKTASSTPSKTSTAELFSWNCPISHTS